MALKGNCANLSDGDVGGRVREPENGPFKFSTFSKHCHLLPWQTYYVTIFLMKKIMLQSYTWYRTQTGCFIFCKTSKRCIQQHSTWLLQWAIKKHFVPDHVLPGRFISVGSFCNAKVQQKLWKTTWETYLQVYPPLPQPGLPRAPQLASVEQTSGSALPGKRIKHIKTGLKMKLSSS